MTKGKLVFVAILLVDVVKSPEFGQAIGHLDLVDLGFFAGIVSLGCFPDFGDDSEISGKTFFVETSCGWIKISRRIGLEEIVEVIVGIFGLSFDSMFRRENNAFVIFCRLIGNGRLGRHRMCKICHRWGGECLV